MTQDIQKRLAIRRMIAQLAEDLAPTDPAKALSLDNASTEIIDFVLKHRSELIQILSATGGVLNYPSGVRTPVMGEATHPAITPPARGRMAVVEESPVREYHPVDDIPMPPPTPQLRTTTIIDGGEEIELVS